MNMKNGVVANWTGKYPCYCTGEWQLFVDGVDYSHLIPNPTEPMDTHDWYRRWYFDKDYEEQWHYYVDGKDIDDWIADNSWIKNVPADPKEIYFAFKLNDWRYGECGGCI